VEWTLASGWSRLVTRYSDRDVHKILGGNMLRVMEAVEKVADRSAALK
jgi:microsomal dipeptidase-like Zn-dependent dipeptidase